MNLPRMKAGMGEAERMTMFNNAMTEIERLSDSIGRMITDLRKELDSVKRRG